MISQWIHEGLRYIAQHPHYGYFFSFIVSCLESLPLIGTVIPGSVTMTGVGTLIGTGTLPLIPTMISAVLGAFTGDLAGFLIGRLGEERIFKVWPFKSNRHWLEYGRKFFEKHGMKSVIIGRFIGPIRSAIPMIASLLGMSYARFFLAGICSAIMWAILYITPGIILGRFSIHLSKGAMAKWITIIIVFLVILLLLYGSYRLLQNYYKKHWSTKVHTIWMKLSNKIPLFKALENNRHHNQNIPLLLIVWLIVLGICLTLLILFKPLVHQTLSQYLPHIHHYFYHHQQTFNHLVFLNNHLIYCLMIGAAFLTFIPCSSFRKSLFTYIIYTFLIGLSFVDKNNYIVSILCLQNYLLWMPLAIISFVQRTHYENYLPPVYIYYGILTLIINLITIILLQVSLYNLMYSWVLSGIMISLFALLSYPIKNNSTRHLDSLFINVPFIMFLLAITFLN